MALHSVGLAQLSPHAFVEVMFYLLRLLPEERGAGCQADVEGKSDAEDEVTI